MRTKDFNIRNKDTGMIYVVMSSVPNGHGIHVNSDFMFETVEEAVCFFYNIGWKYDRFTDTFSPDDGTDTIGYLVRQVSEDRCVEVDTYPWVNADE